jgi:hypothetical protein
VSQHRSTKPNNSVDKLTDRAHTNTSTSLKTMVRDRALSRSDRRPRPAISTSQATAHSTPQQNRYLGSRHTLLNGDNPTAVMPPSLPTPQVDNIPFLPSEIMARILSYYCIHDKAITFLPTRELAEEEADFNKRMLQLPMPMLQNARGDPNLGLFKLTTKKMPIAPPYQSHQKPEINLLLTNKMFHDEFIKQFYSKNIFTFLGGSHDMVWLNTSMSKRAHVRHIQLQSLWELGVTFFKIWNSNQRKAHVSVKPVWGRSELRELMAFGSGTVMFPNLRFITRRIRLKFNNDCKWPFPSCVISGSISAAPASFGARVKIF